MAKSKYPLDKNKIKLTHILCLGICGEKFWSKGKHNRMCFNCQRAKALRGMDESSITK